MRKIPFGKPWITQDERQAVLEVLEGDVLTHGPQGRAFESEFAEFVGPGAHALSLSSGMAALHLSYLALGLGPGDEVLVPAQTHIATVHAVECVGARPVFVDCEPDTGNVSPRLLEAKITRQTKAIGLVHFLGIPCDMKGILALAEKHALRIVEDCALALGARIAGKHVGLFGDTGCFSFYPVKHITTGDGGMLITRHKELAAKAEKWRAFGVDRGFGERAIPGFYDVPALGLNYRMSDINAAIGRQQLKKLPCILERRASNFDRLRHMLQPLGELRILDGSTADSSSAHYCLSVVLRGRQATRRDAVVEHLKAAGIGTSIYYPQPTPRMTYYKNKYGYAPESVPEAARISDHSIALPVGPHLGEEDMAYIARKLTEALSQRENQPCKS